MTHAPKSPSVFLSSESAAAKYIARPIQRFMGVEASGGIILLIATAAALIWVNSPWGQSYTDFWHTEIDIAIGGQEIFRGDLTHFVNDVLMVLFFFVVGVEIKSELVVGQLRNLKYAAMPAIAAVGGMALPAIIYVIFNLGGGDLDGWAIPMATDIAFALGVVSLLGNRIPRTLRVFLLTLAIADDIGAILIIALFYTDNLELGWLFGAIAVAVAISIARRVRIWYAPFYYLLGAVLWWFTFRSGIHATIAGVALGLMTPARPLQPVEEARGAAKWLEEKPMVFMADIRWANFQIAESVSVADRVKNYLHPITSFIIVPIFALANAGIEISSDIVSDALRSEVTMGVFFGLLVGKTAGVTIFGWAAVKTGVGKMPEGMRWGSVIGVSTIAGIGFTVAIFVSQLAFGGGEDGEGEGIGKMLELSQAKLGIFAASILAAVIGGYTLHHSHKSPHKKPTALN